MIKDAPVVNQKERSIGIVIPTFQAAKHLHHCLPPLIESPLRPRLLVIDSSSTDDTVAIAKDFGVETLVIPKAEFNHGLTREKGRQYLNTDIVVMITQDAYAYSSDTLELLVEPIMRNQASISYARQLPRQGSDFFEAFPRLFNYPAEEHIRGIQDASTYGVYTFFCSNSCAAYLNSALDEIGGFSEVLFGEDTVAVAKLLHRGHKIAYAARAQVYHSHNYSLKQEFFRHFDIGIARQSYKHLISLGGKDSKRGKDYVLKMCQQLWDSQPTLLPYAFLQTAAKLLGYRFGQTYIFFSKKLKSEPLSISKKIE